MSRKERRTRFYHVVRFSSQKWNPILLSRHVLYSFKRCGESVSATFKEKWLAQLIEMHKGEQHKYVGNHCAICGNPREGTLIVKNPTFAPENYESRLCGVCWTCAPILAHTFEGHGYIVRIEWFNTKEKVDFT
jgi:hypothetical protein